MNLIKLQNKIYQQNKAMGWWDKPRSFDTIINLIVSELSEAVEGHRKDLMDDHLPQHKMAPVEAADCAIRCFDYLGSVGNDYYSGYSLIDLPFDKAIASATNQLTNAWLCGGDNYAEAPHLIKCIYICFGVINNYNLDPIEIILEKVEYNLHRADHKPENRAKAGGKKY